MPEELLGLLLLVEPCGNLVILTFFALAGGALAPALPLRPEYSSGCLCMMYQGSSRMSRSRSALLCLVSIALRSAQVITYKSNMPHLHAV